MLNHATIVLNFIHQVLTTLGKSYVRIYRQFTILIFSVLKLHSHSLCRQSVASLLWSSCFSLSLTMEGPFNSCKGTIKSILKTSKTYSSHWRVDHQQHFIQPNMRPIAKDIDATTRQAKFNRDADDRARLQRRCDTRRCRACIEDSVEWATE